MSGELKIVVVNNTIQLQQCSLYKTHYVAILNSHHVCPESWWIAAGKPVASPLVEICPNCHYDIHAGIDGIIKGQDISHLPFRARGLAEQAFPIAEANGLTPALTL